MFEQLYLHQKQFSLKLRQESLAIRLEHLKTLEKLIETHQQEFIESLRLDFQKPEMETLVSEIYPLLSEIRHTQKSLKKWMKPQHVGSPLFLLGTKSCLHYEPKGVCLIIAPWNYPVLLTLGPLISALAAGNTAVIKPSELTKHTSDLISRLIGEHFPEEHVAVVLGDGPKTQELLQLPFDHIFFTGSTTVGKIIMKEASQNLCPVTLELGGKSPVIVDSSADLELAAKKILWAKFLNAGQTCVAPDYLFVQEEILPHFIDILQSHLHKTYGESKTAQKNSPDLARIISDKHVLRLKDILEEALAGKAQLITGGDIDPQDRYVAPTLLTNLEPHCRLLTEEIFGPILPILKFKELSQVIHYINERPKPLALYFYSQSDMSIEEVSQQTSSGGLVINDCVIHLGNFHLPFGGVGESGMGSSHGIHGFRSFSHTKAILKQGWGAKLLQVMYPPYTKAKKNFLQKMIRWKI